MKKTIIALLMGGLLFTAYGVCNACPCRHSHRAIFVHIGCRRAHPIRFRRYYARRRCWHRRYW